MSEDSKLDAALDGLNNWYEKALQSGGGFKSDADRQEYVNSLGDPMQHPMFAQTAEDMEGHPLVEAIRQIREDDKTLVELVMMYKDEGNEWMKKKDKKSQTEAYDRYAHALSFADKAASARSNGTEAEKDRLADLDMIRSQILSNRAAASLSLGNYGSCKKDCNEALSAWPNNLKAHYRKAKALYMLKEYLSCEEACDAALLVDNANGDLIALRDKSRADRQEVTNKHIKVLDMKYNELKLVWMKTWTLCQKHLGVSLGHSSLSLTNAEPMQLRDQWPKKDNELISWPVMMLYPQYNQFDLIPDANIDDMLAEQLAVIFPDHSEASPAPWDINKEYELPNLVIYLEIGSSEKVNTYEEWLHMCIENYALLQSGSMEVVKYALKQLNNGIHHSKYGNIDELTYQHLLGIAERASAERMARQQVQAERERGLVKPPISFLEVHLGCTLRKILTSHADRNILARGVLSLFAFVRGNAAHMKFLNAAKKEHRVIEVLNPV